MFRKPTELPGSRRGASDRAAGIREFEVRISNADFRRNKLGVDKNRRPYDFKPSDLIYVGIGSRLGSGV